MAYYQFILTHSVETKQKVCVTKQASFLVVKKLTKFFH
jgi:hypothetical protein